MGETGSGKELIAQELHRVSTRSAAPLRVVNCAALPDALVEGLLFGHERGAYTGAHQSAPGLFEQAQGGTVFLDEVGELSLRAQAALLRFLETRVVTRIGAPHDLAIDVRVVAATHRDLEALLESNSFRRDLLYRLNTVTLRVPPLRERRSEIEPLSRLFVTRACASWGLRAAHFDPLAVIALENYHWPGNVRELRNVVEQALLLSDGPALSVEHLPPQLRGSRLQSCATQAGPVLPAPPCYRRRIREFEVSLIASALNHSGGNRRRAAVALGIPLRTLLTKIRAFGVKC
jgi:DNA-binding NtrC family response regulator